MKYLKEAYYLSPLILISFLLVFTRPFVGLSFFGYRIGELMVVFGFLVSIASSFYYIFFRNKYKLENFQKIQIIFSSCNSPN